MSEVQVVTTESGTAGGEAAGSLTTAPQDAGQAKQQAKQQAREAAAALKEMIAPARPAMRIAVLLQVLASVAAIAPYVAIAELAREFIDGSPQQSQVWWICAAVLIALTARIVLGGAALSITHYADVKMQADLRRKMVAHLSKVPLGWFSRTSSGMVRKAAQNDIGDIHYLVAHGAVETTAAICVPLAGLGYLIWLDWRLALLAVATLPIYLVVYAVLARGMTTKIAEMNSGIARISATIVEFVSGIAVVKTFGETGRAHAAYRRAATEFGDAYDGWVRGMMRLDALATIPLSAPVVLLVNLVGGIFLIDAGWLGPVEVVVSALVAMTLPVAIMTVSFSMQFRRTAQAAAGRIAELLTTPVLSEPVHPRLPQGHQVEFDDVTFSYDGEHEALSGVSLTLAEGSVTALVGPSGSGKSTLATLVPRFHDPASGTVSIGGVDVRRIAGTELYRHVGFVLQDVQLLALSVLDNIRLAKPEASLDDVRRVARAAQIDDRIMALPRGYSSVVGDDALLSGGEAQRVSIARALLADPPVLVLDEATAFADPDSESRIQAALAQLIAGRTLLVIAHRLASIAGADRIVVLDQGRVVESGTHEELLDRQGRYARMWRAAGNAESAGKGTR